MLNIHHSSLALALVFITAGAHAQSTPAAAAPAPAAAAAATPSSPAKKELVQRVLKLQQGGIERLATAMTEEPAVVLVERASAVIAANVPKERQEAVAKDLQAEVQKYLKDTVPQVRKSAQQLAPSTIGTLLDNKFNEEELRQKLRPRGFSFVILDKDGRVALRKPLPWGAREISRAIDKFPSRIIEVLERNPAGR